MAVHRLERHGATCAVLPLMHNQDQEAAERVIRLGQATQR